MLLRILLLSKLSALRSRLWLLSVGIRLLLTVRIGLLIVRSRLRLRELTGLNLVSSVRSLLLRILVLLTLLSLCMRRELSGLH